MLFSLSLSSFICFIAQHAERTIQPTLNFARRTKLRCRLMQPSPSPFQSTRLWEHILDEKYRLEEKLGIGGMGTVYRARHLLIDRPVAVKVLNQRFVEDEAARTRFHREARLPDVCNIPTRLQSPTLANHKMATFIL